MNSTSAPGGNVPSGALNGNAITLNGGTLALLADPASSADAIGTIALDVAGGVNVNGNATITATRLAAGNPVSITPTLYITPSNQDLQFGYLTFNNPGTTLTITPVSGTGYGVEFTGAANLNQALTTLQVNTNGSTTSNVTPSVILSGVVTDSDNWSKLGTGTLLLNNLGNASTLTGNVLVSAGVLAFTGNTSGSALGTGAITLNGGGIEATNATLSADNSAASSITMGVIL